MGQQHFHPHAVSATSGRPRNRMRVLVISLILTLLFVAGEALAGIWSGSLALVADAGHNFTDAFGLGLAAVAYYFQSRPGDHVKTYGYLRAGVLAAFLNALTLGILAAGVFWESYRRLVTPEPVAENVMLLVASVGLVLNLAIAHGLNGHGRDLNLRAAWIHMIGDAATCLAIIAGAVAIRLTGMLAVDPILSILIAAVIVWTAWDIFKDSLNILLEGSPKGIRLSEVTEALRQVPGVLDVHDLHVWSLDAESAALSCHLLIQDMPHSESEPIRHAVEDVLCSKFAIGHSTIQLEHSSCDVAQNGCRVHSYSRH
jgi:cobalt-zinc-cadmium efflux system protein